MTRYQQTTRERFWYIVGPLDVIPDTTTASQLQDEEGYTLFRLRDGTIVGKTIIAPDGSTKSYHLAIEGA